MPDDLFTGAFKALIELGGAGWIVAGLFLLGIIYLYRENNKVRDRAEAISERTVIALERVGAVNQNVATTLDGSTKAREDMARLLSEIARQTTSLEGRQGENFTELLKSVRDLVENYNHVDRDFDRLFAEHKEMLDLLRANNMELVRSGRSVPAGA